MIKCHNFFTRRSFLEAALGTTAGIIGGGLLSSCSNIITMRNKPGSKIKFGLVTYQWGRDWDLPTLIANCEKTGIYGVELRTTHAHGVEPSLNKQQRREVKSRFDNSPVTNIGIGSNENFDSPDPQKLQQSLEAARQFIILSHDTGGSGVKVKPNNFHKNIPHEKTIEQIGKSLNALGQFGYNLGQQIRLEVHGQCQELPTIKAIMDVADHPNVAVCWNSNDTDLDGKGLEYNFNLVKNRLGATTHVRELNIGTYPYQKLFNLLAAMDYDGWVLLEARSNPADRIKALIEQRHLFQNMINIARLSV